MSHQFFGNPGSVWFPSNLNNSGTLFQSTSALQAIIENPQSNIYQSSYETVQLRRFMCGACGENVLEENLAEHHSNVHPGTPFIADMYELFEIDERIHCLLCDIKMFDHELTKHIQEFHIEKFDNCVNANYEPNSAVDDVNQPDIESTIATNIANTPLHGVSSSGTFKCKICGTKNIRADHLKRHRSRLHPHLPKDVDLFECEQAHGQKNEKMM